ncbi:TetR/AcrR family transcriptional regulator [Spirillospora sp. NPDC029432]|uniref:TetR/AcrR family transcriptional regulator n=1 Tax=Spirillospora sp. NPDC029432 TaxID=3154599 RepID=UPI003453D72D
MGDKLQARTPRRSTRSRPTDGQLLDAARAVFAEHGYQRATMGTIAARADSTKPTLYAHFGDKAALYRATLAREGDRLRTWVTGAYASAAGRPVNRRVHTYVMALFTFAAAHPEGFRILFDDHAPGDLGPVREQIAGTITEAVAGQIRDHLAAEGRPPGPSAGLLAAMLVGMTGKAAAHALRADLDPLASGELTARVVMAALQHLDPGALDLVDT